MNRSEVWLADLGYVGKVRPVLILSVAPGNQDRALVFIKKTEIDRPGSCHLLRHTCATHMLEGGADIRFHPAAPRSREA